MINETWRLCPQAEALYACDARWWRARGPSAGEFGGLRLQGFAEEGEAPQPGCLPCGAVRGDNTLRWCGYRLGAGANSGFQAINLAAVAGAARIVLTGYDMSRARGVHWHGPHRAVSPGLSDPDARMLAGCARIIDGVLGELRARGIEAVNASRETALRAWPRATIEEALA